MADVEGGDRHNRTEDYLEEFRDWYTSMRDHSALNYKVSMIVYLAENNIVLGDNNVINFFCEVHYLSNGTLLI